jgi:hypothetical protein
VNYLTHFQPQNGFLYVALLMNGTAALIGVARFQRDRGIADTAEEALSRRGVSDACHNCGPPCGLRIINRQAREHLSNVQSCDQSILATQTQVLQQDTRLWEALCGKNAPEEIHSSGTFVPSHRQDGLDPRLWRSLRHRFRGNRDSCTWGRPEGHNRRRHRGPRASPSMKA